MKKLSKKGTGILALLLCLCCLGACVAPGDAKGGAKTAQESSEMVMGEKEDVLAEGQGEEAGTAETVTLGEESALLHKTDHSGRYCYESLTKEEQIWYEDMYAIMDGMHEDVVLSVQGNTAVGEQGIDKVFQCVMNDHPELFYVKGYHYTHYTQNGETTKIIFSGAYTMNQTEREEKQKLIDAAVDECLAGISPEASGYDKVKYVYEYLISHTEYDKEAEDNQNICSVFIGKKSVCQGYAKATQYLLDKLGIGATLVIGYVYGSESHAWNLVFIDGEGYYVDTTWGDASYRIAEEGNEADSYDMPAINYDYLCVTTKQLLKTHVIDNVVPLPECVSLDANYYVMEKAYFTEYDEEQVKAFFERGYEEGKTDVTLKCADEEVYHAFFEQLITSQKIFRFLNSPDGVVAYAEDKDKLSLTFWLVNE